MEKNTDLFLKTSYATGEVRLVNDEETGEPFWIKPSDIIGDRSPNNYYKTFLSSFGSCESETTAQFICEFLAENGDRWYPVKPKLIDDFIKNREKNYFHKVTDFASDKRYAGLKNGKILFTNLFIERCAGFRAKDEPEAWKVKNVFELQ